jgi:hypothetical protein
MTQYAAIAKKIPLTLKHGESAEGILIGQEQLCMEFETLDDIKEEIDRFMSNPDYVKRKEESLTGSVISIEKFEQEIEKLVSENGEGLPISYKHIDTENFRETYLQRCTKGSFDALFARVDRMIVARYFPVRFFKGGIYKIYRKVLKQ